MRSSIPVVASGGAGSPEHLRAALADAGASAALAASIFHYGQFSIAETKEYLASHGVPVRRVDRAAGVPGRLARSPARGTPRSPDPASAGGLESTFGSSSLLRVARSDRVGRERPAQPGNGRSPPCPNQPSPVLAREPSQQESQPMATAVETPVETMPNEPEANKLFRMVDEVQGVRPASQGRPGPRDAAGRRAPADAVAAALQRRHGTADVPAALAPPEADPRGHRRHRLRPHRLRSQRRRDPLPRQPVPPARAAQSGRPPRQHVDPRLRGPGPAARPRRDRQPRPGHHHPGRRHRQRQVHHDRLDAPIRQPARALPRRHDRGPDRVHLQGR